MLEDLFAAGPSLVALMLTTRCNFRCAYCYQDRSAPRSMQLCVLEAAVDRFLRSDHSHPTLAFFGGEPLLEMSLVRRAVEIVRAETPTGMTPDLEISTNGVFLDEETARFLVEADVHITLSIDGLPGAQNQRGPGSFDILDRLLVRFGRDHPGHLRTRFAVSVTLSSGNVSYLAGSFRYFVSRGVREIRVVPVFTHDSGWGLDARDELDRQLADVVEESLKVHASSGEVWFQAFQPDGRETSGQAYAPSLCGTAGRKSLFVDMDGSLAPCGAMARSCLRDPPPLLRDAIETLGTFDLTDPDLAEKLAARERKVRDLPLLTGKTAKYSPFGRCGECPALLNCVICPASIAFSAGAAEPDRIPAIQCDFNRLIEKHRMAFHRAVSRANWPEASEAEHRTRKVRMRSTQPVRPADGS
ncbi:MAG TPA: radical SAM protein [Thermoanaerobaculia bacterium]